MLSKSALLIGVFLLLVPAGGASAADLIVASGTAVTKNSTESFGLFMVAGRLTVEAGAALTFSSESHIDGIETAGIRPEIIINGGSLYVANRTNMGTNKVGNGGNYSYLTMNGGQTTVVGSFKLPDDSGGENRIYLNGGIMHCLDIELRGDRDAIIYVGDGILRLDNVGTGGAGDYYDPTWWVTQGWLQPAAGFESVNIEYVPAGGYTEITALSASPRIQFDTAYSQALETVSPASILVVLTNPEAGQTYTVQYAATNGTATGGGVDYTLEPDTLTFYPGQTTKTITIDIVNDGLDEQDETIVVSLSNPTGGQVQLGIAQHCHTIIDPRPDVEFKTAAGSGMEHVTLATVVVVLSHEWSQPVTVEYAVTGGTATGGGVDYTLLGNGTLTFTEATTAQDISIRIADDQLNEGPETIVLTLFHPTNAKLGAVTQHTFGINDNDQLVILEEFVGESFSPFNHASTIAQTHNGTLVAAWYGGSSEGAGDVSIWVSRNDGSGWTPRIEVDNGDNNATWNPVLFQPSSGPLLLYFKYSGSPSSWRGAVRKSYDDGQTWSQRILLPTCSDPYLSSYGGRFIGPVKNKPLELPDGSLLCGSSTEHDGWRVHMEIAGGDYTNDFELIGPLGPLEGIQPTFLVHDDSRTTIQALCRAPGSGSPTPVTWSYDGGQTWTSLSTIALQTSKGLDAVTINNLNSLRNRWHLLAYNPSGRYPLRVAVSQNGVNWNVAIDNLDPDPSGDSMDYPAIIQTSDKMLHLTYSWSGKKKIKHVVLNPYILLSEPPCVPTSCADFDGDAFVDTLDLGEISASWLSESLGELTDLNCDRKTDFSDFSLLAANWLQGCP